LLLAALHAFLWVIPATILYMWALTEATVPQKNGSEIHCAYTSQQQARADSAAPTGFTCEDTHAEAQEYSAYTAAKDGQIAAYIPAARHWLNRVLSDPVSVFTLILAISTIGLWLSTRRLWRGAEAQARDFKRSVAEASRSADAMRDVATAMDKSVQNSEIVVSQQRRFGEMQMRAYLSVLIGGATFQERERNWRFEAAPLLKNTGNTTARKIKWRIAAAILPIPLPDDFKYPLPPPQKGTGIIGSYQDGTMSGIVPDFVDDAAVIEIKRGIGSSLFVWGYVRYEDVFGKLHRNTFAQQLWWSPGPNGGQEVIRGLHLGKHNRSN
jgi:hypothetical protein